MALLAPILAGQTTATVKGKITDLLNYGLGMGQGDGLASWGAARTKLNTLAGQVDGQTFADREAGSSVRSKINALIPALGLDLNATMLLDFTKNRYWIGGPSAAPAVVRQTRKFDFNDAGVLTEYAPNVLARNSQGALLERAGTNIARMSDRPNASPWSASRMTVAPDVAVAPDGTQSADNLIPGLGQSGYIRQNAASTFSVGETYTWSCFIRSSGISEWNMLTTASTIVDNATVRFSLLTGTVSSVQGDVINSGIIDVGGGWYRAWFSFVAGVASGIIQTGTLGSGESDGVKGAYLWGSQIDVGPTPTSYIPTTTAAADRAADLLTIPLGTWYGNGQGQLLLDGTPTAPAIANNALDVCASLWAAGKTRLGKLAWVPA